MKQIECQEKSIKLITSMHASGECWNICIPQIRCAFNGKKWILVCLSTAPSESTCVLSHISNYWMYQCLYILNTFRIQRINNFECGFSTHRNYKQTFISWKLNEQTNFFMLFAVYFFRLRNKARHKRRKEEFFYRFIGHQAHVLIVWFFISISHSVGVLKENEKSYAQPCILFVSRHHKCYVYRSMRQPCNILSLIMPIYTE